MPNILIVDVMFGGVSANFGTSSWRRGEKQRAGAIGVNAMIKELWNVGLKVIDLDREVAFLREVGASLVLRERVSMVGEEREYAILMLGGVRMLLFETVVFENLVPGGVRPGLTHAVYEVDDLDTEYVRISALGAEVLIEPTQVSAAFGRRRLAFFRSHRRFRLRGNAGAGTKDLTPVGDQEARHCRNASHSEVGTDFKTRRVARLEWIAEYISARVRVAERAAVV